MTAALDNALGGAAAFIKQPFTENMGLKNWGLLVIFVVTVAILWTQILRHIVSSVQKEI